VETYLNITVLIFYGVNSRFMALQKKVVFMPLHWTPLFTETMNSVSNEESYILGYSAV
jgi:hypothetical protein